MRECLKHLAVTVTPWTVACQVPPSMGFFPGKNTGVGCWFLLQGIFLTHGLEPGSPALQADSSPSEPPGKTLESALNL